jgi:putative DNA primase/helicase
VTGPIEPAGSPEQHPDTANGETNEVANEVADVIAGNAADDSDDDIFNTDTGNGKRFVRRFGDLVRYATDLDRWYVWNGRFWAPDSPKALTVYALTEEVVRELRARALELDDEPPPGGGDSPRVRMVKWATVSEGVKKRRAVLDEAMAHPRIQVTEPELDPDPHLLTVENGAVDLRTGELRPASPADRCSRSCTAPYRPQAENPGYSDELELFLKTFLPDPLDQRFVFATLGRALIAGNKARTFPIIWGGTTSGKSQLLAGVHAVLGSYVCAIGASVFRGNLDDKPRPDLVKAMYTRLAYATEASKSWSLHADQIKRLTGGDSLPYRNLYDGTVNTYPRFTPLLVTNEMPRITGADIPLKRRILVMHFDRTLESDQEDPKFKQRFLADQRCREALLARLVRGARDPITEHVDNIPERYALATLNAFGSLDHVEEFLEWLKDMELLVPAPEGTPVSSAVKASDLYDWYRTWTAKYGDRADKHDTLSMRAFGARLRDDMGWRSKTSAGVRWADWVLLKTAGVFGIGSL